MGVGRFRTRVTFRTRATGLDACGDPLTTFTDLLTIGGDVRELSGNERQNYSRGVETIEDFVSVRVPARANLETLANSAIFVIDGQNYEIVGRPQRFSGINRYTEFVGRRER